MKLTKPVLLWISVAAIVIAALIGAVRYFSGESLVLVGQAPEIDWRDLSQLDYLTGQAPQSLKQWDGKVVKIPGFMVPLEDNLKKVTHFLLVPTPQACIHVPPPPPNQMVYVEMDQGESETQFGPIWVYGRLDMQPKRHLYGESSFSMKGLKIKPYD